MSSESLKKTMKRGDCITEKNIKEMILQAFDPENEADQLCLDRIGYLFELESNVEALLKFKTRLLKVATAATKLVKAAKGHVKGLCYNTKKHAMVSRSNLNTLKRTLGKIEK